MVFMKKLYVWMFLLPLYDSVCMAGHHGASTSHGDASHVNSNNGENTTSIASSQDMQSLMTQGNVQQAVVDAFKQQMSSKSKDELQQFKDANIKFRDDYQQKIDNEADSTQKARLQKGQAKIKVWLMIVDDLLKNK